RILRRGRAYGAPGEPRGLLFVALGASIARGFEFIQQTWNVNPNFRGLHGEPDALVGSGGGVLTVPANPVRLRLRALPRFVTTRGGGYFFLPAISALRRLAS